MWSNKYINDKQMQNIYKGLYFRAYVGLIPVVISALSSNQKMTILRRDLEKNTTPDTILGLDREETL